MSCLCLDVNECEDKETMVCGNFSQCENHVGGYSCQCYDGYEGVNGTNCKGTRYFQTIVMGLVVATVTKNAFWH